jgi:hypothetical protein
VAGDVNLHLGKERRQRRGVLPRHHDCWLGWMYGVWTARHMLIEEEVFWGGVARGKLNEDELS